jgi:hypothetical protein
MSSSAPRLLHSKFTGQGAQPTYLSSKAKWSTEAPAQLQSAEHAEESIVTVSVLFDMVRALEVVPTKQIHSDLGVSPRRAINSAEERSLPARNIGL